MALSYHSDYICIFLQNVFEIISFFSSLSLSFRVRLRISKSRNNKVPVRTEESILGNDLTTERYVFHFLLIYTLRHSTREPRIVDRSMNNSSVPSIGHDYVKSGFAAFHRIVTIEREMNNRYHTPADSRSALSKLTKYLIKIDRYL